MAAVTPSAVPSAAAVASAGPLREHAPERTKLRRLDDGVCVAEELRERFVTPAELDDLAARALVAHVGACDERGRRVHDGRRRVVKAGEPLADKVQHVTDPVEHGGYLLPNACASAVAACCAAA